MTPMTTQQTILTQATFGELLRRWRRRRGLNQGELGELLVPKARCSTVSCWENDLRLPSRRYLSQIVALTGIPADLAIGLPHQQTTQVTV